MKKNRRLMALFIIVLLWSITASGQNGSTPDIIKPGINSKTKDIPPGTLLTSYWYGTILAKNTRAPMAGLTISATAATNWTARFADGTNYPMTDFVFPPDIQSVSPRTYYPVVGNDGQVTASHVYAPRQGPFNGDFGQYYIDCYVDHWIINLASNNGLYLHFPTSIEQEAGSEIYLVDSRKMYLNINSNNYEIYDLLNDTLRSYFNANYESIKNSFRDAIINNVDRSNPAFNAWPDYPEITYTAGPTVKVSFPNVHFDWDWRLRAGDNVGTTCRFHLTGSPSISFAPRIVQNGTKYFLTLSYLDVEPNVDIDAQSNQTGAPAADAVCAACGELADFLVDLASTMFDIFSSIRILCDPQGMEVKIPLGDLTVSNIIEGVTLTTSQANEVQSALPLNVSLGVNNGCLSLNINLLNQAGSGYTPTASKFDYMGFASPYYAFQTPILKGLSAPSVNPNAEQENIVINNMANYGAKTFRFSVPWGEVFPNLTSNDMLNKDPDSLLSSSDGTGTLDIAIKNISENYWSNTDMIFQNCLSRGMEVIPQLFQQEMDLPKIIIGIDTGIIAPDSRLRGIVPDTINNKIKKFYYVDGQTYLYFAKIFANAAVRRYKNFVAVWGVESELNAARISTFVKWRHGNCWAEEGTGGFQERYWRILINAVRNNDPTAKVASNFHMLNLAGGINRLGADLDIIGVDVYPDINGKIAYPVMGYMVGEVVRATKSLLQSRGWASKEVHVMETGYTANDPETTLFEGGSVNACTKKFTFYRQAKFMSDAISSSANFGATGFFWWSFLDNELSDGGSPEGDLANFVSLMSLNNNDFTIKPAATTFKDLVPVVYNFNHPQIAIPHSVSGIVSYANTATNPIGNAIVSLTPTTGTALTTMSNATTGAYSFIGNVVAGTYTLTATKNDNWGGVTGADALAIARHSVGLSLLTGLNFTSGDANINNVVNNTDAVLIVRRAVGLDNSFSAGDWGFSSQQVNVGTSDITAANISGLVVGDVNASYTPTSGSAFQKRSLANLKSGIDKFVLSTPSSTALGAVSIKINLKSAKVASISSKLPGITSLVNDAGVSLVWFAADGKTPVQFEANEAIVTVTLAEKVGEGNSVSVESELADINGVIATNGLEIGIENEIPTAFALEQNYPNPFNPTTTICYQLPKTGLVSLKVYDALGRVVATLVDDTKEPGYHTAIFDGSRLASGVYIYRILVQTEKETVTAVKRLMLLK